MFDTQVVHHVQTPPILMSFKSARSDVCSALSMPAICSYNGHAVGWNPCGINNGGCSHLCIAHPTRHTSRLTHRCTCPSHYSLAPDEKTCLRKCLVMFIHYIWWMSVPSLVAMFSIRVS